jgi:serine/threonine protein kinase
MEDLSNTVDELKGSSFFAGSTRWMAPELILALVEDDGPTPRVTTHSDVYAFASVCLEVSNSTFYLV